MKLPTEGDITTKTSISKLFSQDGELSKLDGFEFRQQQQKLAVAVWDLLQADSEATLAAEAPPGVGKTFALLAPAMLYAASSDEDDEPKRILFLTAGITLQEQLIQKDIPHLNKLLGLDMPYGLLKGRRNYVCLRRAAQVSDGGMLDFDHDGGKSSLMISEWLKETKTGDLSELPLPPNSHAVMSVASQSRSCLGSRCPFMRQRCFVHKNYRIAQEWMIIVANYHLFFSHALTGGFPVPYDILICDEAHRMPDAFRSVSTIETSSEESRRLLRQRTLQGHDEILKKYAVDPKTMAEKMDLCRSKSEAFFSSLDSFGNGEGQRERSEMFWNKAQELASSLDAMLRPLGVLETAESEGQFENSPLAVEAADVLAWRREVGEFKNAILWCAGVEKFPEWAYWRSGGVMASAPVNNPDGVAESLFIGNPSKCVFVSATLAIENDFALWTSENGIVPDKTLIVDSPFDFKKQMSIMIVPMDEKVGSPEYDKLAARIIDKLCSANGGRTLVLLSSLRLLGCVAERLKSRVHKFEILVQGSMPQAELLQRFRTDETSVLVGSVSFREGVDIPGDGLTQVIIDRIPFPHPFDPLTQARAELDGKDSFMRVTLPTAKMYLRQAVGRLIRRSTDHGRVVILDSRVLDKSSWKVRQCLPNAKFSRILLKK